MSDSELNDPNVTQQSNSFAYETIQRLRKRIEEQDKQIEELEQQNAMKDNQIEEFITVKSTYTDANNDFTIPPLEYRSGVEPSAGKHNSNKTTDCEKQCTAEIQKVDTDPIDSVVFDVSKFPFRFKNKKGAYNINSANFTRNKDGLSYVNEADVQNHTL